MKNLLFGLTVVVLVGVVYLVYAEISFSPLGKIASEKLFSKSVEMKKLCDINLLGISAKGEYYELYQYNVGKVEIDNSLPNIDSWENNDLSEEAIIGKWKSCPIDSVSYELYEFTLTGHNWKEDACSSLFNEAMENPNNHYSFIHINELQQYFLLYSSKEGILYYLRRNGF